MRRSRSDSAVEIQLPRGDVIRSRDATAPAKNNGGDPGDPGDSVNDVMAERPLAADPTVASTNMAAAASAGDTIVVDVDEENRGTGNQSDHDQTTGAASAAASDKFRGLVRKHGAAFQVTGMLRATREDRQQKAFNSVKTEIKRSMFGLSPLTLQTYLQPL